MMHVVYLAVTVSPLEAQQANWNHFIPKYASYTGFLNACKPAKNRGLTLFTSLPRRVSLCRITGQQIVQVEMKQSHDSSDAYKLPVTATRPPVKRLFLT